MVRTGLVKRASEMRVFEGCCLSRERDKFNGCWFVLVETLGTFDTNSFTLNVHQGWRPSSLELVSNVLKVMRNEKI